MNFSEFEHAFQRARATRDPKLAKKAFKEVERVVKQIEKSRVCFQSMADAQNGISMYEMMAQLSQQMAKPMAMVKYAQRIEALKFALENGMIAGGPSGMPDGFPGMGNGGMPEVTRMSDNRMPPPSAATGLEAELEKGLWYAENNLYQSAINQLEQASKTADNATAKLLIQYNLGAVYFTKAGDGQAAKEVFEECVAGFEANPAAADNGQAVYAACLENLMLLSLGYDEYMKWAEQLRRVAPSSAILAGQVPEVKEKVEVQGWAWWQSMFAIAMSYYNRNDSSRDPGMYGSAASVFDLVLQNRRSLRVPRDELKTALYEYNALIIKIVSENIKAEEQAGRRLLPGEYNFMLEKGINTIDEFTPIVGEDENIAHERKTYTMYQDALKQV